MGTGVCWLFHECSLWNKREKQLRSHVSGNGVMLAASQAQWELLHRHSLGNKEERCTVRDCEWELGYCVSSFMSAAWGTKKELQSGEWGLVYCIVLAASRVQPLEQKRETA